MISRAVMHNRCVATHLGVASEFLCVARRWCVAVCRHVSSEVSWKSCWKSLSSTKSDFLYHLGMYERIQYKVYMYVQMHVS